MFLRLLEPARQNTRKRLKQQRKQQQRENVNNEKSPLLLVDNDNLNPKFDDVEKSVDNEKRRTRIQNRWFLYATLARNPWLLEFRKKKKSK